MEIQLNTSLLLATLLSGLFLMASNDSRVMTNDKTIFFEEICDNGIDDDEDGLIDLNDPDCDCEVLESISLIPNPSFEDTICTPSFMAELNCAVDWIQASVPTTDFIHMAGWMGWEDSPPPLPFPDGEGIIGFRDGRAGQNNNEDSANPNWKEYAGACLLSPLKKDSTYRFEFDLGFVNSDISPPINISFFGSDCAHLPFGEGNSQFGCPTNGFGWIKLGSKRVFGGHGNKWVKVNIEITPEHNIPAIAIGPDCPEVYSDENLYYFFDNLLLADPESFDFQIKTVSHPCKSDFTLKLRLNPAYTYQWYKDGIALVGETSHELSSIYGEGVYSVKLEDDTSCRVSPSYIHRIPTLTVAHNISICAEDSYPFGDRLLDQAGYYIDTFTSVDNCDSIALLTLDIMDPLSDTIEVKIFEGEKYDFHGYKFSKDGTHMATIPSYQNCDSLVQIELSYFDVFIPNVFSPNYDGINDYFTVFSEPGLIENIDLSIYDRWGDRVFNGIKWDGRYKGEVVGQGTFVYVFKLTMNDGIERELGGSVIVLK